MAGDRVRIAQFWQAVEIFSPQSLPKLDPENHTVDLQRRDRVPWEQPSRLPEAKPGYAWRHEVYGGLYELSRVRDVLVSRYGQDRDEEPPPKGKSALFACTVNEDGFLVPDSMVVSACAWGAGRVSQGASPIGDLAADTERYADSLARQSRVRAGVRVLGAAIRGAVPDEPGDADNGTHREVTRLDLIGVTGEDLQTFISWLAAQLSVTDCLQPCGVRVRSRRVKIDSDEEGKADPFLNSFLAQDLELVTDALRAEDAGPALASYLTPEDSVSTTRRKDVRHDPEHVLGSCRPDLIPPGRWVAATDRPLAFSRRGGRTGAGMLDILRTASQVPDWHSAVSDFRRSLAEVQSLSAERRAVSAHVNSLLRHRNAREAAAAALRENAAERMRTKARRPALAAANETAARRQVQANATASAYKDTRPGLFASRWLDG